MTNKPYNRAHQLARIHGETPAVYQDNADGWDKHRPKILVEKAWLDRLISRLPPRGSVLDLGCGAGQPVSEYFIGQAFRLTGLDGSTRMLEISQSRFPQAEWIHMDMRELDLNRTFDGIVSWDGFFHLTQGEQRAALPLLAGHLKQTGALLLTIGHEAGEVTGTVEGETVYHASLSAEEYRDILKSLGFDDIEIRLKDESCDFHSVLLASRKKSTNKLTANLALKNS